MQLKKYNGLFQLLTLVVLTFIANPGQAKAQTIKKSMKPAVNEGGFRMDGYYIWCSSVIKVNGVYHMFASRWPSKYGMNGWLNYSEVVRATSDNIYGPYTFQEVVISKRKGYWDSERAHNPKIVKVGDKFVLYYISTANETGYAWSKSVRGPWHRSDSVAVRFSNPAPLVRKDGSIYLFGRRSVNDIRIARGATSQEFDRKYTLINKGRNLLPGKNQLEDPTIWWANGGYNVICSDFRGDVTGRNKNGVQYYSKDGVSYKPVSVEAVYTKNVTFDDGTKQHFRRRERPFVFVNEQGEITAFFTACLPHDGPSRVVVQPVDHYVPGL